MCSMFIFILCMAIPVAQKIQTLGFGQFFFSSLCFKLCRGEVPSTVYEGQPVRRIEGKTAVVALHQGPEKREKKNNFNL